MFEKMSVSKVASSFQYKLLLSCLVVFSIEFFLFRRYVLVNIAPYYPAYFDQTDYLKNCYRLLLFLTHQGNIHDFSWIATGVLYQLFTVGFFFLFGASRLVALSVNFLFFVFMQCTLVYAAYQRYQSRIMVFLLWGLVIAPGFLYRGAGGLFDFRMDFAATCLYGALVSLFVLSRGFSIKKFNVLMAITILLLLGIRFISATYLIGFFSTYLGITFFSSRLRSHTDQKNLAIILLVTIVGVALYFFCFYKALYGYYYVGHVLSNEKNIRLLEQGVHSLGGSLLFYPHNFWEFNITPPLKIIFWVLIALAVFPALILKRAHYYFEEKMETDPNLFPLILFIVMPYVILTLDAVKSPLVFSLILVPFWWIVCEMIVSAVPIGKKIPRTLFVKIRQTILVLVILCCFWTAGHHLLRKPNHDALKDWPTISALYTLIGNQALAHHQTEITISFNKIVDYLASNGISDFYFEKYHRWLTVNVTPLGGQIFPISKKNAIDALLKSNYVVFEENCQLPAFRYPLTDSVMQMRSELSPVLNKHFYLLKVYYVNNCQLKVFERN